MAFENEKQIGRDLAAKVYANHVGPNRDRSEHHLTGQICREAFLAELARLLDVSIETLAKNDGLL